MFISLGEARGGWRFLPELELIEFMNGLNSVHALFRRVQF
jgi:hypothetical protein